MPGPFHFPVFLSGRWESNPDYIHPMDAYYHYTTARRSALPTGVRRMPDETSHLSNTLAFNFPITAFSHSPNSLTR